MGPGVRKSERLPRSPVGAAGEEILTQEMMGAYFQRLSMDLLRTCVRRLLQRNKSNRKYIYGERAGERDFKELAQETVGAGSLKSVGQASRLGSQRRVDAFAGMTPNSMGP